MNLTIFTTALAMLVAAFTLSAADSAVSTTDSRVFEMRVYYSPEGKLPTLEGRFREHTTKLFTKHGIENIGYWVPIDN
jgi:hypothetical protein